MSSVLSRSRTVAAPGFNRWLVPPAALAIHLSIGMAYGFSVFWLPLSAGSPIGVAAGGRRGRLATALSTLGWMYTLFFVLLGSSAALFGPWLEREGPRKAGVVRRRCWGGGFWLSRARRPPAPDLAAVARLRRHRRLRARARLHLAGVDADQVVSRSARHGHRPRDHGIWRRRHDRHAAGRSADARISRRPDSVGVWQTFVVLGALYFVGDDGRRVRLPRPAARLAARRRRRRRAPPRQRRRAARATWTARGRRRSSGCCGPCSA